MFSSLHPMTLGYANNTFFLPSWRHWYGERRRMKLCKLAATAYCQWHRTLYTFSFAQRWRWNAHPPYISSSDKHCQHLSRRQHSPLAMFPSPSFHFLKKRKSCCFYVFSKSLVHLLSFAFLAGLQSHLQGFFPTLGRTGNIFQKSVLKNTNDPEMTKVKPVYMYKHAHMQLLC